MRNYSFSKNTSRREKKLQSRDRICWGFCWSTAFASSPFRVCRSLRRFFKSKGSNTNFLILKWCLWRSSTSTLSKSRPKVLLRWPISGKETRQWSWLQVWRGRSRKSSRALLKPLRWPSARTKTKSTSTWRPATSLRRFLRARVRLIWLCSLQ